LLGGLLHASIYLSSSIAFLIRVLDGLLSYNTLYVTPSLTWVHLLEGLFQSLFLSYQYYDILLSYQYYDILLSYQYYDILLCTFVPVIIYSNAEIDKSVILSANKGKAGIYQWKHNESNKIYIGSAVDLSKRLIKYYSPYGLKETNNYICRALILHGYSAFSLSIVEYIDISNLSKDEAKTLILLREQYYIDYLLPEFNILKLAGNSLGYKHTEETIALMSLAKSGENHPLFGKSHTAETIAKIQAANSGENHPNYGKNRSAETRTKISEALSGENNPMYGRTSVNHPMYGKSHSVETLAKMSAAKGGTIYVYNIDKTTLVNSFPSARKAAEFFNCCHQTILNNSKNGKIFKEKWFLSTSLIINE